MRDMQRLSPKLKEIQNKYKSDPQMMQKKMMEFYKEHKFNPMGGCFPTLLQMPILIILYSAIMSPIFIYDSAHSHFLFINKLYAPLKSHAGVIGDGKFGIAKEDTFSLNKAVTIYTKDGSKIRPR